jgi:two-component system, OmpR family, sensor histidine kinase ChvG
MRQSMEPLRRLLADSGPRGQRALSVMEGALERLDHLVATARRVDETTAELLDPPRRRIDLSALVERTLEGYSPLLERQNLELEAFVAPGIQIRGGEDLLENVLENIVDNAISVSPRGGRITVVLTKPTDDTVELLLSDEGPGVPPELLDRIFDRSFSTRQQRTQPEAANAESGTSWHAGIGLWVVRRNIAAMGGWVYADNNADRGLTVRFTLPSAN